MVIHTRPFREHGGLDWALGAILVLALAVGPAAGAPTNLGNVLPAAAGDTVLTADLDTPNACGTGVELVFAKGSHIVVAAKGASAKVIGPLTIKLPYYSLKGIQATLSAPAATANITAAGDFDLTVSAATAGGALTGEGVSLAGFVIDAKGGDLKISGPAKKTADLTVGLTTATIGTALPHLLLKDDTPVDVLADRVELKADAQPSFTSNRLASPVTVHLLQPLDFGMVLTGVDVAVKSGKITRFGLPHFDLLLPPDLKDEQGGPIVIRDVKADADLSTQGVVVNLNSATTICWNAFILRLKSAVLDLSPANSAIARQFEKDVAGKALADGWEGLYVTDGTLELPHAFDSGGKPTTVGVQNFYVDGQGINGKVTAASMSQAGIHLMEFPVAFKDGFIQFSRGRITAGHVLANMSVPGADKPVGLAVTISTAGLVGIDIDTNQQLGFGAFGMKLQIDAGTFTRSADGVGQMLLTGAFTFPNIPELSGAVLQFKDLGIDTKGHFYTKGGSLTLTHPASIDLGPIGVHVEQVELAEDHIKLTGGVRVSDDLPMNGEANFEGLTIRAGPKVELGGLGIKFRAMDMASVEARLARETLNGIDCFKGAAKLSLDFAGPADLGGGADMVVGGGCWFVVANVDVGMIPLGDTGLAIVGFDGGLGHNIGFTPEYLANPRGKHATIDDVIPNPKLNNLVCLGGVQLGTAPDGKLLAWVDATMTVAAPPLLISFDGIIYYLDPTGGGDRSGYADITWNTADQSFRAALGADFYYPTRKFALFEEHGSAELFLSPQNQHLYIGWPVTGDGAHPLEVSMVGLASSDMRGGVGFQFAPDKFIKAGFLYEESFLGILKGEIDGQLDLTPNPQEGLELYTMVHARGEADLVIISAYVDAQLQAWLNAHEMDVAGELSGSVSTFLGSVSASVNIPRTKIIP